MSKIEAIKHATAACLSHSDDKSGNHIWDFTLAPIWRGRTEPY
jgi:hypothetical protein